MNPTPSFKMALPVWLHIAMYSFGGPAAQIAVMHRQLVEEKKWISETRFLHALNYCMLLPGPEAQQLATYCGWLLHGIKGGIIAGALFILPGFIAILVLSLLYVELYDTAFIQALFYGIKPAVLAIVIHAVIKIGSKVLKKRVMILLAIGSFIAIYGYHLSFALVILSAGIIGLLGGKYWEREFLVMSDPKVKKTGEDEGGLNDNGYHQVKPSWQRLLKVIALCLALWFIPIGLIDCLINSTAVFSHQAAFFSRSALVTFGGAYSVLSYVAQQAVEHYHWITPIEMLDGLAMAETTPGPLIQVVQFVGFMGAYRDPGAFSPVTAGILASLITTWVTFIPCFMFIFAGAPYIETLRGIKFLTTCLSAITAAVVGAIANLALWFGIHTWFHTVEAGYFIGMILDVPAWNSIDVFSVLITTGAAIALIRYQLNLFTVLGLSVLAGIFRHLF